MDFSTWSSREKRGTLLCLNPSIHGIDTSIKFVFLGKSKHKYGDGDWVDQKISELKCGDSFITWDNYCCERLSQLDSRM